MPVAVKYLLANADRPNANGRVYPRQLLERVVATHDPATSMAFVHDDDGLMMQNVVGQVQHLQLTPEGQLYATIRLVDTPRGLDVQELLLNDARLQVGLSGVGTILDRVVQPDYRMNGVTVDLGPRFEAFNRLRKVLMRKMGLSKPVNKNETPSSSADTLVSPGNLR